MNYLEAEDQGYKCIHDHTIDSDTWLKILLRLPRELTKEEDNIILKAGEDILNAIERVNYTLDPKVQAQAMEEKAKLIACFPEPIFVEELPNGYSMNDPYFSQFPWFRVTTKIGPFGIGWRKRVINLDWSETIVTAQANELFPNHEGTKFDYSIHCSDYTYAKQCIERLMNEAQGKVSMDQVQARPE